MKNIIRHYKKIAVCSAALIFFAVSSSCSSDYLEIDPATAISEQTAYSSANGLMSIISGMHRDMYVRQNSTQPENGQGGLMLTMDAMGEDLVFTSTSGGQFISAARWVDPVNNGTTPNLYPYQFYYELIRNANLVIAHGPNVPVLNTTDADTVKKAMGEAYAFRAFSYYMLVQIYGKRYIPGTTNSQLGVPLRLIDDVAPMARNTVEEVYAQINNDLTEALSRLSSVRTFKSHFNDKVVLGLRARVALTQGNYALAASSAKLARAGFSLMSNTDYILGFKNGSLETNGEWMWGSTISVVEQSDAASNFGAYISRNYTSISVRQAPKAMNKKLYAMFPATDVRTQVVDPTGAHTALALPSTYLKFPYTSQKFLCLTISDSRVDVPYMRAAEMYLIEAEALARSNDEAGSKIVFNQLAKNRNPSYTGATTTGAAYITEILNSRRIELWGEGFRFLDLKRLGQGLDRTGANHSSAVINSVFTVPNTDNRWQWLIPKDEINANPLIEQNPL